MTEWKTVATLEVSTDGRVRIAATGRELSQRRTRNGKYTEVRLQGGGRCLHYQVHRLVALAHIPNPHPELRKLVDHKDGDQLNNRVENLRWATHQENMWNRLPNGGSSRYKGVTRDVHAGQWKAQITINGVNRSRLCGQDEIAAARLYDSWARELFGEYAWLNRDHFPEIRE